MNTSLLLGVTIEAIHTPACEPVHAAWVNERTTPIATSMAVLQLADGHYLLVEPCEVQLPSELYPSLGLGLSVCTEEALTWRGADKRLYTMSPLAAASMVLPFSVHSLTGEDLIGEGVVSDVVASDRDGRSILFRHIFPPMTLGLAFTDHRQAPN